MMSFVSRQRRTTNFSLVCWLGFIFVEREKRRVGITKEESGGAQSALGQGEGDDR